MSEQARAEFDAARIQQTTKNDARRIRQRVEAALQGPVRAGVRWPFELVQNAHDVGPRDGDDRVEITFVLEDDQLIIFHTGKPFVAQELAALFSGGSSKEFDSEETTGRFGTGFLVTHALSTRVDVEGVLTTKNGPESFVTKLERDGDEESLQENIEQTNQSLADAKSISANWIAKNPTARFVYHNPNRDVALRGLDRLERTLPYLYSTCSKLGHVRIRRPANEVSFEPDVSTEYTKNGFLIRKIPVTVSSSDAERKVIALRIGRVDGRSALLAVLEECEDGGREVVLPEESFARVFVTFPIAGTDFLPFNVVVDGDLAPLQERDGIAMHEGDKTLIDEALSAFPILVQYAVESRWHGAHTLARIGVPDRTLGGEDGDSELAWWRDSLLNAAKETAAKPVIQTDEGLLPALSDETDRAVSFLVPAIDVDAAPHVDYNTMHEVASAITTMTLPSKQVARDWQEIACLWADTGVPVVRLGLEELTDYIKEKADSIAELPVREDPIEWLGKLFLLAADMGDQNVRNMVNGLLPDQHGKFRNTGNVRLYIDDGISEEVKDIATLAGLDLRGTLLNGEMARILDVSGFETANDLMRELMDRKEGGDFTESKAIDDILNRLEELLPDDSPFDESSRHSALHAAARLASYLAENDDIPRIRRCPLLNADGCMTRITGSGQQILAPSLHWPESAQPYADLYTKGRLLSDHYCDDEELGETLAKLIEADLVISAPLFEGRRAQIEDVNLLREMSHGDQDISGLTVRDQNFGQIAFLATDLVQRCGQDRDRAKLLLDFVLNVAASEDRTWRESEDVAGSRQGDPVDVHLYGATWPFELKVRSWIPVERPDEDGIVPMPASESSLREILDPSWLRENRNAVELLHQVFGFKQLTLLLDSLDDEIEGDLVRLLQFPELVKVAAKNPEAVKFASELESADVSLDSVRGFVQDMKEDEGLAEHLANRREQRRRVQENQNLGSNVEDLVRENLERAGFSVRRTGVGSDFEIAAELGDVTKLKLVREGQSWLVEVKSTRDRTVRMTDTQARTAASEGERFLLCVVPVESGGCNPTADDVGTNMRFIADIGVRVESLCDNLEELEDMRCDITSKESLGVQLEVNPGPVRVRVASSVWEDDGFPLDELAERLLSHAR